MDDCYQKNVCNCKKSCSCEEGYECCSQQADKQVLGLCVKKGTCNEATGLCKSSKSSAKPIISEFFSVISKENFKDEQDLVAVHIILGIGLSLVLFMVILHLKQA
jgi:hypothetical protein